MQNAKKQLIAKTKNEMLVKLYMFIVLAITMYTARLNYT